MQHAIPVLDRQGLRKFGLTTGTIVAVLFGVFFPWLLERPTPRWPWILAGVLIVWALVAPATLRPVYNGWMRLGLLMSRITTPIIMGIVFYLVITPVALIAKIRGKDAMSRSLSRDATSYRVESAESPPRRLEKPF